MSGGGDTVRVCCRFRPPNAQEKEKGETTDIEIATSEESLSVHGHRGDQEFTCSFDHIFPLHRGQDYVFDYTARKMVPEILQGYNTTIFAYGQTGSGKTHTMMGDCDSEEHKGIIPRLVEAVFDAIEESVEGIEFTVKISYIEIYNERIHDLLDVSKVNLRIRDSDKGVWIQDVTEVYVGSYENVMEQMERGGNNRKTAATSMNMESSRSHSVFCLTLNQKTVETGSTVSSKLFLVDLAGSEKVRKSKAAGQTLTEAKHINKSLSALGNVINACAAGDRTHIPYRDSKLTRLLSDAIGGNSKTCLIITCSPSTFNLDETVSTLRFGIRAKQIQNKAVVNQEKSVSEYKRLLESAEQKIALQDKIIQNLKDDIRLLKEVVTSNGLTDPTAEKYAKLKRLQAEAEKKAAAAGASASSSAGSSSDNKAKSADAKTSKAVIEAATGSSSSSSGDNNDAEDTTKLLELRFDLEQKLKDLEEENIDLKDRMGDYEAIIKENEELANLNDEYKQSMDSIQEKERQVAAMMKEHEHFRQRVKESEVSHQKQVDELSEHKTGLENQIRELEMKVSEQELQMSTMTKGGGGGAGAGGAGAGAGGVADKSNAGAGGDGDGDGNDSTNGNVNELGIRNQHLMKSLQRKCQQFIDLQIEHSSTVARLSLAEQELQNTAKKAQQLGVLKENIELKKKLAASEKLCKKLLDSGLYWRQRRRKSARIQKIVIPIQSGGGGKSSSS